MTCDDKEREDMVKLPQQTYTAVTLEPLRYYRNTIVRTYNKT